MENFFKLGKIVGCRSQQTKNRTTGELNEFGILTILFETKTSLNDVIMKTTDITVDTNKISFYRANVGRWIAIPYIAGNSKDGKFFSMQDTQLNTVFFDGDPFDTKNKDKKSA
jgi:phosphohistidine swiveling domain-containing protein